MRQIGLAQWVRGVCLMAALASCAPPPASPEPSSFGPAPPSATMEPPPPALRVAQTTPAEGGTLPLEGAIRVRFNQPIERTSVEEALSRDEHLPGRIAWPAPDTLEFSPVPEWPRDTTVRLHLSPTAHAQSGARLAEEVSLAWRTTGYLRVGEVWPPSGTAQVPVDSAITVTFDRPVVAEDGRASAPSPLSVSPSVEGEGAWQNAGTYSFTPSIPLRGATTYEVVVRPDREAPDGSIMADDFRWRFTTEAPRLAETSPRDGETLVGLDAPLVFGFNQSMDRPSLLAALEVRDPFGQRVGGTLVMSVEGREATFAPSAPWKTAAAYTYAIGPQAASSCGVPLAAGAAGGFGTVPPPAILGIAPADGSGLVSLEQGISVHFASPMKVETILPNISIEPRAEGTVAAWDEAAHAFHLGWTMMPSTNYTVILDAAMTDPYGNRLARSSRINFSTAPLNPMLTLPSPTDTLMLPTTAASNVEVFTRNVRRLNLVLRRVRVEQFARAAGQANDEELQALHASPPLRTWEVALAQEPDDVQRTSLALVTQGTLAPGIYRVEITDPEHVDLRLSFFVAVAEAHLALKVGGGQALVWALDETTRLPLAHVPIKVFAPGEVHSAATDANGVARLTLQSGLDLSRPVTAVLGEIGRSPFAVAQSNWDSGLSSSPEGFAAIFSMPTHAFYLRTDRPLYKPGSSVNYWGVIRRFEDDALRLPAQNEMNLRLRAPDGASADVAAVEIDGFGTFSGEVVLPGNASLGSYWLSTPLGGAGFEVAETRTPEAEIEVLAAPGNGVAGETASIAARAVDSSGEPLAGVPVAWDFSTRAYTFASEDFAGFTFDDVDLFAAPAAALVGESSSGTTTTAEDGEFQLSVPASLLKSPASCTVVLGMRTEGQAEATQTRWTVHGAEEYVGLRSARGFVQRGQALSVELAVLWWDGFAVPNAAVDVTYGRRTWIQRPGLSAIATPLGWEVRDTPEGRLHVTTDSQGAGQATIIPTQAGVYSVLAEVHDAHGRIHQARAFVWVSGSSAVSWPQVEGDRLRLTLEKPGYAPGETVRVLIPSPFAHARAWVSLERGSVLHQEVRDIDGPPWIYEFTALADYAPNVYLNVLLVDATPPRAGGGGFRAGTARIAVSAAQHALHLSMTRQAGEVTRGGRVAYELLALDATGEPVKGAFSVSVVDQALLTLDPRPASGLTAALWGERALGVRTAIDFAVAAKREVHAEDGLGGGEEIPARDGEGSSDFPDTAYWNGEVRTDATGRALISFVLPDIQTSYELRAEGVSRGSEVGEVRDTLRVTRTLFVQPHTPRFLVVGDRAQLSADITNNTPQALSVVASLEAAGVTLLDEAEKEVRVPASASVEVQWLVQAEEGPAASLIFTASSGPIVERSRPAETIPVLPAHGAHTQVVAGKLSEAGTRVERLVVPVEVRTQGASLRLNLIPSVLAMLVDAERSLAPLAEAGEEDSLRLASRVMVTAELARIPAMEPDSQAPRTARLKDEVTTLVAGQQAGGGWAWWKDGPPQATASALAVLALTEAAQSGEMDGTAAAMRGLEFLRTQLLLPTMAGTPSSASQQALVQYVLAAAGTPSLSGLSGLQSPQGRLTTLARNWIALGHLAAGETKKAEALAVRTRAEADITGSSVHWAADESDMRAGAGAVQSTAAAILLLVRLNDQDSLLPGAVQWLTVARGGDGSWGSPTDTAWAVAALAAAATDATPAEYSYSAKLGSNLLVAGEVHPGSQANAWEANFRLDPSLASQPLHLEVARSEGTGELGYQIALTTFEPAAESKPQAVGLTITREYYSPACTVNCRPLATAARGESLRAVITLHVATDLWYLQIEDPFPAGLEVRSHPQGAPAKGGQGWLSPATGEDWLAPYLPGLRVELHPDRLSAWIQHLPPGTYSLCYDLRAMTAGEYLRRPPRAFAVYFPEMHSIGQAVLFRVGPGE